MAGKGKDRHVRPPPYKRDEAKRKIVQILREGSTVFSEHLIRDIQRNRRGVSQQDVLHVLQTGEIIADAVWDEAHDNWKYRVEGLDLEDEELRAITIIIDEQFCVFVVTAF
jgi:hypothetical protein